MHCTRCCMRTCTKVLFGRSSNLRKCPKSWEREIEIFLILKNYKTESWKWKKSVALSSRGEPMAFNFR